MKMRSGDRNVIISGRLTNLVVMREIWRSICDNGANELKEIGDLGLAQSRPVPVQFLILPVVN